MANPNIVNVATINGVTTYLNPSTVNDTVLLTNPAGSGHVYKVNLLNVSNINGSTNIATTISLYTNGAVAQGSAPSGGTAYPIVSTVSVPANASLIVTDKTTAFYLQEGRSISITSATASKLTFTVSYEDIS